MMMAASSSEGAAPAAGAACEVVWLNCARTGYPWWPYRVRRVC